MSQVAGRAVADKRDSTLKKISVSSSQMVDSMNEMIWALNSKNDTLENLVSHIRNMAFDMYEDAAIELKFSKPETIPHITVNGEVRRNIYLIVKEALHNALKHSGASLVEISSRLKGNKKLFEVKDNGVGINSASESGHGLSKMSKRAVEISTVLKVESPPGNTRISLEFQLISE